MRYPLAAIFFTISGFIFFAIYTFITYFLDTVDDALTPMLTTLSAEGQTTVAAHFDLIQKAFGILSIIFFLVAILLIFLVDSWRDDPEYYYKQ